MTPFRFPDYAHASFDFCPHSCLSDPEFYGYFYQVFALAQGLTLEDTARMGIDDLECLFSYVTTRAMIEKRWYAEFWAQALGGKK